MVKQTPALRRSQKERSELSRQKIIVAATQCITDKGYSGTSFNSIAKQAGLSVGAIQHQFGDKAEILIAVIESSLMARASAFALNPVTSASPKERVREFVHRMWHEGYGGKEYGTAVEILIAMRKDPQFANRSDDYFGAVLEFIDQLWMGVFWDLKTSREQHQAALRLTFNSLNGMALQQLISNLEAQSITVNLDNLTNAVIALLLDKG